jgi:hypothetical protein
LIVIGAGLDRIKLVFKRIEEKLNATVSSDTSFHLPYTRMVSVSGKVKKPEILVGQLSVQIVTPSQS